MKIKTENRENVAVVSVSGMIDASNHQEFLATVINLIEKGTRQIVFNLQELEYMSSAGIRALIQIERNLAHIHGSMVFCCLTPFIQEVFEIAGLTSDFLIYPDDEMACASFSSS